MCTLSVLRRPLPFAGDDSGEPPLWRVSFNRDERRTRPPALPPVQHIYGDCVAVHPIDPLGGGTWIAVSSAGLVFALLNGYSEGDSRSHAAPAAKSRGLIIPALLSADTLAAATTRVQAIDPAAFLSFRLVIVADHGAREAASDGQRLELGDVREGAAWMRSSSSLRPDVVLPHRHAMFQEDVAPSLRTAAQDRFHLTRHATDPALGVLMERDDARTMSVTSVEVFAAHVRMTYRALDPDAATPEPPATIDIARQRFEVAMVEQRDDDV
jgi:hypothetical protein